MFILHQHFTFTHLTAVKVGGVRSQFPPAGRWVPDLPRVFGLPQTLRQAALFGRSFHTLQISGVAAGRCPSEHQRRWSTNCIVVAWMEYCSLWVIGPVAGIESGRRLPVLHLSKPDSFLRLWKICGKCALRTNILPEMGII